MVSFHADSVVELRVAFEEACNDYLQACEKFGKAPQQAATGKMTLRVPPEVHGAALEAAQAAGTSLTSGRRRFLAQAAHAG